MTIFINILTLILLYGLISGILFWKGFQKAGEQSWKAFVPVYCTIVQLRIIQRPWWWVFLFFIPIVNNIMLLALFFEWLRMFGYNKKRHTLLAIITLGIFIIYVNFKGKYSTEKETIKEKSVLGFISSIMFAVVATTIIHTYVFQPYIIPTSSLEKSLLVGDFLLVSKFHYGARLPMTPLSFPMIHDTLPVLGVKSYIKEWQLPYMRLPAFQNIKRNDIVVFSWPTDTVSKFFDRTTKKHHIKPIDKKSNYVKRCVGLPGDTLSVSQGYVYVNGNKNQLPDRSRLQFAYKVNMKSSSDVLSEDYMYSRFDITTRFYKINKTTYVFPSFPEEYVDLLKKHPKVAGVERYLDKKGQYQEWVFPHSPEMPWNVDFFGPIYIPKKGSSISLNIKNIPLYKRIIETYEGHTLEVEGTQIKIDGTLTNNYTFEQNYYWMMGDNRNGSEDARIWGFVPFDHVVGKPVFIWMSIDWSHGIKVRWDRLFTTVSGKGKPISFFKYFLITLGLWYGFKYYRKRKKGRLSE